MVVEKVELNIEDIVLTETDQNNDSIEFFAKLFGDGADSYDAPVVVMGDLNQLVDGHHRVRGAQLAGLKTIWAVRVSSCMENAELALIEAGHI